MIDMQRKFPPGDVLRNTGSRNVSFSPDHISSGETKLAIITEAEMLTFWWSFIVSLNNLLK